MTRRRQALWCLAILLCTASLAAWWLSRAATPGGTATPRSPTADSPEAAALRERLVRVVQEGGRETPAAAEALAQLALQLYRDGRGAAPEAIDCAEAAYRIDAAASPPDGDLVLSRLNLLGALLHQGGRFAAARLSFERIAGAVARSQPGSLRHAKALLNVAEVDRSLEDFPGARRHLEEALGILRNSGAGGDSSPLALAWNSTGLALHELGELEEAKASFARAREILAPQQGEARRSLASVLNNLGRALHDLGDLSGARAAFEESLRVLAEPGLGQAQFLASSRNNLGYLLHELGDRAGARTAYEEALKIRRELYPGGHPDTAWTLANLGLLDWDEGHLDEASRRFAEALELRVRTLGPSHRYTGHSRAYVAALRIFRGDAGGALEEALLAEEARAVLLGHLSPLLAERTALRLTSLEVFGLRGSSLDLCVAAAGAAHTTKGDPRAAGAAWEAVAAVRGLVLEGVLAARNAASSPQAGPSPLLEALDHAAAELAAEWTRGLGSPPEARNLQRIEELRRRKDALEESLAREVLATAPGVGRTRQRLTVSHLRETLRGLPWPAALVAYVEHERPAPTPDHPRSFERALSVFTLTPEGGPALIELGPAAEIEREVAAWRAAVTAGNAEGVTAGSHQATRVLETGTAVRRLLWDRVAAALGPVARVFIVPDGVVNEVNLAALPVDGETFLVETAPTLHVLSSEAELGSRGGIETAGLGLLALGAPGLPATGRSGPLGRLGPLPGTELEVNELAALARRTPLGKEADPVVLVADAANRPNLWRSAPGKRVLHLATHGFFLDAREAGTPGEGPVPAERARALEALGDSGASSRSALLLNPLLLSGLVLSPMSRGDAARQENGSGQGARLEGMDGVITSLEITGLDLRGVEWVVLSACRSGQGTITRGEGVFGLRRAFEIAGARSLVTSLWPVGDESTRAWMRHLYEARLLAGRDTAESVRQASLQLLAERRRADLSTSPFFWGGFVATGDWR